MHGTELQAPLKGSSLWGKTIKKKIAYMSWWFSLTFLCVSYWNNQTGSRQRFLYYCQAKARLGTLHNANCCLQQTSLLICLTWRSCISFRSNSLSSQLRPWTEQHLSWNQLWRSLDEHAQCTRPQSNCQQSSATLSKQSHLSKVTRFTRIAAKKLITSTTYVKTNFREDGTTVLSMCFISLYAKLALSRMEIYSFIQPFSEKFLKMLITLSSALSCTQV